jgi:hypothetical protein
MGKRMICLVAALLLAGSAVVSAATPGPVGWWKFDETAGVKAADAVGGRSGDLLPPDPNNKGLGPKWVTGKIGGAIEFNGTGAYVQLPIGDLINTLSSSTFAVWVNWAGSSTGSWQRIFDFGSGTSIYAFLAANRSGTQSPRFAMRSATVGEQIVTAPAALGTGWHHLAVAIDSAAMKLTLFVDGAAVASGATTILPKDMGVTTQNWVARSQYAADAYYKGDVDELRIYDRVLTADEVANAMSGGPGYGVANTPVVADKTTDVPRDLVLSWTAGQVAKTHDVYFGTVSDSVANATTAKPLGVLVSPGQAATTYNAGRLVFGQTYYWRVDEVGAAPDYAVYKGNVWSFTVEPYSITIGKSSITATASSSQSTDMGPGKTVDGSGLNANDQHSTNPTDMWLSAKGGAQPTWIQYAFDKIYSLDKMLVWNSNQALESIVGYGAKNVTIEYGVDPNKLTKLGDFVFAQAPGDPTCTADTKIDFAGVAAKFVKLTIKSNWGGVLVQYGLSEVRFSYIPVLARNPSPASGTANLYPQVTLSWRAGRDSASHEVYLSTDQQAVVNSTALAAKVTQPTYTPAIELAQTYYWKIIEVNTVKNAVWPGDVWSFATQPYLRVYTFANTADRAVTYGTERTLTAIPDWTVGGAKTLVVTFRGAPGNAAGKLYLKVNGVKVSYSDDTKLTRQVLQQWNIDLASLGVDLKNIQSLKVGVDSQGTGTASLDDLRLFRVASAVVAPVDPGTNSLSALYAMEGNVNDTAGKGLNGTATGNPTFVAGQAGFGQALKLDGAATYATLPIGNLISTMSDMTIATWVNWSGNGGIWQRIFDFGSNTSIYMFLTTSTNTSTMRFAIRTAAVGEQVVEMAPILPTGWHHVAISINSATKVMTLYRDGTPGGTGTTTLLPKDMGVTTLNYLGKSQYADPLYNGLIDDFRIFNRVLSDGEVRYLAGDR